LEQAADELQIAVKYDGGNKSAVDDLAIVRARIQSRDDDRRRLTDFDAMKTRAQAQRLPIPVLSPRSTAPIHMNFADQSLQTILESLGKVAGINVLFDADYRDKKAKVQLQGVTFQEALDQITFAHRLFYKVLDKNTIIIVQDSQAKRRVYEDLLLRTFYLQNVDTKEVEAILKTALGPQAKVLGNPTVNALTVIGTVDQLALAERVIGSNDKAKGEVMVEVQIMEVNRNKLKEYGIRLSNYGAGIGLVPNENPATLPTDLNIRAHLLSSLNLSDFIVSIPASIFTRFLQNEDSVKILASPRLRAAEGKKTALKIGTEVPVPVTTFTATQPIPGGGGGFSPATSFQYRNVGVNLELTPRVSASGEITLELGAEFSLPGNESDIGGQRLPTFFTRTINGILRVRDSETTLVGGLLQTREIETFAGALGVQSVPILNRLIPNTSRRREQTEILISITPHLVRAPKIVEADLQPMLIGTQDLVRVEGARPPLFGAHEELPLTAPSPAPAPPPGPSTGRPPATVSPSQPNAGEQPTPAVTPPPPQALPTPIPAPGNEPAPEPTPTPTPPPAGPSSASFSPPDLTVRAGDVATVSLVVMNAQNVSSVEMMISFDPAVLDAVDVGPGTLLTLDGAAVGTERNMEPGRIRARLTRPTPTSGSGVVAQFSFRGMGPGTTGLNVEALVLTTATGGAAAPALSAPARVTVTSAGPPQ
jgi:general secretion pathway protein D